MIIREASELDYDGYYQIKSDEKNVFWGGWATAPNYETFKNVFISRISDTQRREYVCIIDGQIVGYLAAVILDSKIEISYGIRSIYSGQGIATALIGFAVDEFTDKTIIAWVSEQNIGSQKCLLKNGFIKSEDFEKRSLQLDKEEHVFCKWERKSAS